VKIVVGDTSQQSKRGVIVKKTILATLLFCWGCILPTLVQAQFERDIIKTAGGDLEITFIGHGSLMLSFNGKTIQIDPFSRKADYAQFPKADLVLLTHHHRDHLDSVALEKVRTNQTKIILTEICAKDVIGGTVMKNGDEQSVLGIKIRAVPAYNLVHKRDNGQFFHPKGDGNGYVLSFADKRIYIAGDTENTPEMKALQDIDYAFLPMNLPYTMTPEMVADAARTFKPKILYPYHYGDTDPAKLVEMLKNSPEIEVRVRRM
jgi:L-ascorbate metabolism protein UlaG (beta-lactamase superfamily)